MRPLTEEETKTFFEKLKPWQVFNADVEGMKSFDSSDGLKSTITRCGDHAKQVVTDLQVALVPLADGIEKLPRIDGTDGANTEFKRFLDNVKVFDAMGHDVGSVVTAAG